MKEATVPFQITKAEFQIMNVLWNSNQPLSYSDIINEICKVEELAFSKRSVFVLIKSLVEKNLMKSVGLSRGKKAYVRIFSPALSRVEWCAQQVFGLLNCEELQGLNAMLKETINM